MDDVHHCAVELEDYGFSFVTGVWRGRRRMVLGLRLTKDERHCITRNPHSAIVMFANTDLHRRVSASFHQQQMVFNYTINYYYHPRMR